MIKKIGKCWHFTIKWQFLQELGGCHILARPGPAPRAGDRDRARASPPPRHVAAVGRQHPRLPGGQPGRPVHPQPDGGGAAARLPRHAGLYRRAARHGRREWEIGELVVLEIVNKELPFFQRAMKQYRILGIRQRNATFFILGVLGKDFEITDVDCKCRFFSWTKKLR